MWLCVKSKVWAVLLLLVEPVLADGDHLDARHAFRVTAGENSFQAGDKEKIERSVLDVLVWFVKTSWPAGLLFANGNDIYKWLTGQF